jgi:hypothetical protein
MPLYRSAFFPLLLCPSLPPPDLSLFAFFLSPLTLFPCVVDPWLFTPLVSQILYCCSGSSQFSLESKGFNKDIFFQRTIKQYDFPSPRDEDIVQNVLSSSSWFNITFELKVWWWFKREILEHEKRRQVKGSYRWDKCQNDVEIPTMDRGRKLQMVLWEQWWDICKDYEMQTSQSDHFCVEWDVDAHGTVHGILLVMKHDATFATVRNHTSCMVEYFNETDFSALREARIGSLFEHCEKVEGDTLAYFYGPGSLLQHRCNYGVKFGSSKSTPTLIGATQKKVYAIQFACE